MYQILQTEIVLCDLVNPEECKAYIQNTFQYVIDVLRPTFLHAYQRMVVKGTYLHRMAERNSEKWLHFRNEDQFVISSYSYTERELDYILQYSERKVLLYNSYAEICSPTAIKTIIKNTATTLEEMDRIVDKVLENLKTDIRKSKDYYL